MTYFKVSILPLIISLLYLFVSNLCAEAFDAEMLRIPISTKELYDRLGDANRIEESRKEAVIKKALIKAKESMSSEERNMSELQREALEGLSQYGTAGIMSYSGNVFKHIIAGRSVIFMGNERSGKAAVPNIIMKDLDPGSWSLVAHWGFIFLFVDNDPRRLFVIQSPAMDDSNLEWVSVKEEGGILIRSDNI